jgi:hypothetical protein
LILSFGRTLGSFYSRIDAKADSAGPAQTSVTGSRCGLVNEGTAKNDRSTTLTQHICGFVFHQNVLVADIKIEGPKVSEI